MRAVVGSQFLRDAIVFLRGKNRVRPPEDVFVFSPDVSPDKFRKTPCVIDKVIPLTGSQRVLNSFEQRPLLIVFESNLAEALVFFGVTCFQKRRKENGFLLLLVVIVSKRLEKLEDAIDI